jgi:hypothetical protein
MIPRLSRVVDKQQSADSEPGLARRFGFMSAVTFTLSMLALDVTETVAVVRKIGNDPLSVGVSILIPLAFVAMLAAIHTSTPASRRLWTLLGLVFGSIWAAVSVPNYFLQLTVVRWGGDSVASFADLRAAPWALNVVGWGLFLGLGALATSVGFCGTRRARLARWLFALSGVSMLVLLLGFVMSSTVVQLAGAFSGWFVTLPVAGIITALIFLDRPARSKSAA